MSSYTLTEEALGQYKEDLVATLKENPHPMVKVIMKLEGWHPEDIAEFICNQALRVDNDRYVLNIKQAFDRFLESREV